jgi:hypothetical protein
MKVRSTADKLHLTLDRDEALALEHLLGSLTGEQARRTPWYDEIADALEGPSGILRHTTIHKAIEDAGLPYLRLEAEVRS